jgi:hypothetical protein
LLSPRGLCSIAMLWDAAAEVGGEGVGQMTKERLHTVPKF